MVKIKKDTMYLSQEEMDEAHRGARQLQRFSAESMTMILDHAQTFDMLKNFSVEGVLSCLISNICETAYNIHKNDKDKLQWTMMDFHRALENGFHIENTSERRQ